MFQVTIANSTLPPQSIIHTKRAWLVIGIWSIFLAFCLLIRGGRFLVPLFPLGSVAIGLFLYLRTPALYVGYAWWLQFLGSLIRRMIDQQSGYITPGRWSTTAVLVASLSLITLVKYLPKAYRQGGAPFLLSLLGVVYGILIGMISGRIDLQFIVGVLEWLVPVAFGFHLFVNWQYYPQYRQVLQRSFVWGALVMGGYGIFQYCIAPEWDRFYLNNLAATSFGNPFPFEIRVFSTEESPQGFGNLMMACLMLLFSTQTPIQFPASAVGYVAFLLSAARSGWVGWAAAFLAFLPSLKLKLQIRLILTIVLMAMMAVPLVTMEPFATPIQQRFESFSEAGNDASLQDRTAGYEQLLNRALTEFVGAGIARELSNLPASSIGGGDSGILPLFFSLGWFGALPYLSGILLILSRLFTTQESRQDPFSTAGRAIVIGVLAQVGLNMIFSGGMAMVLWNFLGIGMAAHKYYSCQPISPLHRLRS